MTDVTYQKFISRWQEVVDLPPQTLGPLTPFYKRLTARLKVMPWPFLVVGSLLVVSSLIFIMGKGITSLVSLLQRGF